MRSACRNGWVRAGHVLGLSILFASLFAFGSATRARAAPNLAVVRVGDGSAALSNASTPVFIDVVTEAGAPVSTVNLPVAEGPGGAAPLTMSGVATSEGSLRLSADGRFLTLAGYGTAPGLVSVAASTSAAVNRVVGRVSATGTVDTTTRLTAAYSANNIRGAVSDDGTRFWTTGTAATNGGVQFVPFGPATVPQMVTATPTNTRVPGIFGGQLFISSAAGAFVGISTIGTGLPTTPGQTTILLSGFPGPGTPSQYGFVALDTNPAIAGVDTLYVADDRAPAIGGGIQRWVFNGLTWALTATFAPPGGLVGARGITGRVVSGATAVLYATTAEVSANTLVTATDDGVAASLTFTVLATAPANTVFRGVDFAPAAPVAAVPATSPSTLWMLVLMLAFVGLVGLHVKARRS